MFSKDKRVSHERTEVLKVRQKKAFLKPPWRRRNDGTRVCVDEKRLFANEPKAREFFPVILERI